MNEWRPVSAVAFVLSRGFVPILAVACIAIEISFVVYALSLRESSFLTRWDSIGLAPLVVGPLLAGATAWLMRRNHFTVRSRCHVEARHTQPREPGEQQLAADQVGQLHG